MTLNQLQCFYLLYETQSVSKAAKRLHKSQSALSIALAKLEDTVGEKLFDRVGKKLLLNERGRYFYTQTREHYLHLLQAKTLFQKEKIAGSLRVAASKTIANYLLPKSYYDFLQKYHMVRLHTKTGNSASIIRDVTAGRIDIGFIENSTVHGELQVTKIAEDRLMLLTGDPNAPKKCYIDTINKKWIMREEGSGTREFFMRAIGDYAKELSIFLELGEFEAIKNILLMQKDTVGVLSQAAVTKELAQKKLFGIEAINIDLRRDLFMIYRKDRVKSTLFSTFEEFINRRRPLSSCMKSEAKP